MLVRQILIQLLPPLIPRLFRSFPFILIQRQKAHSLLRNSPGFKAAESFLARHDLQMNVVGFGTEILGQAVSQSIQFGIGKVILIAFCFIKNFCFQIVLSVGNDEHSSGWIKPGKLITQVAPALNLAFESSIYIQKTFTLVSDEKAVPEIDIQVCPVGAAFVYVNTAFCELGNPFVQKVDGAGGWADKPVKRPGRCYQFG